MTRALSFPEVVEIVRARGAMGRSLTALAGPPGVGKSRLAARLVAALNAGEPGAAAILEMDGFHFDNGVLEARGQLARKGAPQTFDVAGLRVALERLRANTESEIAVPVFDRRLEIGRAGARLIAKDVRHLIVEGNYLLLDAAPWASLGAMFATTIALTATRETLRERLYARWAGKGMTGTEIEAKVEGNDMLNAERVLTGSTAPEFEFVSGPETTLGLPR